MTTITVTFEWEVETVADVARRYFGADEFAWVNNWSEEDIADFASRMKSVLNYQLNDEFESMVERYVREEFVDMRVEDEDEEVGSDEDDWAFGEDKNVGL